MIQQSMNTLTKHPSSGGNTVPGGIDGSNGITINPNNPTVFYRLVNP